MVNKKDKKEQKTKNEKRVYKKTDKNGRQWGLATKVDLEDANVLEQVRMLGSLDCTYEEMGFAIGVTERTIANYMKDKEGAFFIAYKKGQTEVKRSLRRNQIKKALNGDNTMMIWMGKQMLDQAEKIDNRNTDVPYLGEDIDDDINLEIAAQIYNAEKDA